MNVRENEKINRIVTGVDPTSAEDGNPAKLDPSTGKDEVYKPPSFPRTRGTFLDRAMEAVYELAFLSKAKTNQAARANRAFP